MTALPERRRRRTIVAAATATGLAVVALVLFAVGVVTLSNSQEGEAVGVDDRPRVELPATPNAMFAVVGDNGELASIVVATLLPDGTGGSIVTIPVNADSTAGFGRQRRPLDAELESGDVESLRTAVEGMLSLTIERVELVDAARLNELLSPVFSIRVFLPSDVIDTSAGEEVVVAEAGRRSLSRSEIVDVLTAVDDTRPDDDSHPIDVAVWSALAGESPWTTSNAPVETDESGRPVTPATAAELLADLFGGEVGARDLAAVEPAAADNPTEADVVVLDRADSTLVFAQVSPALMSTPNTGLKMRIEAQYTDEQLDASGVPFSSNSELARDVVGRMLFLQANVVSVDTEPVGAPEETLIVVTDEQFVEETERVGPILFGPSDVEVADVVLDGVDVIVTLGEDYLDWVVERDDLVTESTAADTDRNGTAPAATTPAGTVDEDD
jgi:hypothetical protein